MENDEISTLKTVYDELWQNARAMIKDMNNSISTVFLFGLTMLMLAPMELGTAVEMYIKINTGSSRWLDYLYLAGGTIGTIVALIGGINMIRWHYQLKNRYSNLLELEKTLEE